MVKDCVRCCNGRHFCLLCAGVWCLDTAHDDDTGWMNIADLLQHLRWWRTLNPPDTRSVARTPTWLRRLQDFNFTFPDDTERPSDPGQAKSARRAALLGAIALPNNWYLYAVASIRFYFEGPIFFLTGTGMKLRFEGTKPEFRRAESGVGFLRRGLAAPPHQLGVWGAL